MNSKIYELLTKAEPDVIAIPRVAPPDKEALHGYHTIPKHIGGAEDQNLAILTKKDHTMLHQDLAIKKILQRRYLMLNLRPIFRYLARVIALP